MIERANQFKMLLSESELALLRERAEEAGLTASDYLRTRIASNSRDLNLDRGTIAMRSDMLRDDIERLRTAPAADRDRVALDARSALGHLLWHVDRLLQACGLDPIPQDDPPEPPAPPRRAKRSGTTRAKKR